MKKLILLSCILSLSLFFYSCSDDDNDDGGYKTYPVSVQLVYPEGSELNAIQGISVKLTSTGGSTFDAVTDATGKADFIVPTGIYEASATDQRSSEGYSFIYNGIKGNIIVAETWTGAESIAINLTESKAGQVVIKELYVGGCPANDGSGVTYYDKYVILYNNSDMPASLDNLCLGMVLPYNATSVNNDYVNGVLFYEAEKWIPAGQAIWYFPSNLRIESGEQKVIALSGAIDHTPTYNNSVNLANSSYYCTYDMSVFTHTATYPSPSELIPTSHYFSAVVYGQGTAWNLSINSPAFYIFTTKGSPVAFANDADNINYHGNNATAPNARRKVPVDWVLDGIEVFQKGVTNNTKRLTATIDAGQVDFTNKIGYSLYRNVDKAATEALSDNKDKLVYSYNMGTTTTDPSGIDAEASMKKGARIVYQDTNNSTNDFHQRKQASLKD